MKTNFKRMLSFISALVIILGVFSGCSQKKDESKPTGSQSEKSVENEQESRPKKPEPITLTMFCSDPIASYDDNYEETPVGKKIKEVTLKIEFPVGDYKQRLSLMMASGEYPDIIAPKDQSHSLVEAGAVVDLTDLIEKYGPNIKKYFGDYLWRLRYSLQDKSIYGIGGKPYDPPKTYINDAAFAIQHRALEDAGYPQIKSLEDYENVIRSFVSKNPKTEEKPTIGVSLICSDGWRYYISLTNPAAFATGAPTTNGEFIIDPETYQAMLHHRRPEEKEYFRWLNKLYNTGLLDPESFTQSYDTYQSKIASGRVVGLIDAYWQYNPPQLKLKESGKLDMMYAHFPVVLDPSKHKYASRQSTGFNTNYALCISKTSKNKERAIQYIDYMLSEEGMITRGWGIEGVHYDVVNGKRLMKDEWKFMASKDSLKFAKTTGIGVLWIFPHYGTSRTDASGQYYTHYDEESALMGYTEEDRKTLSAYGVKKYPDLFPPTSDFKELPYGEAWHLQGLTSNPEAQLINTKAHDIILKGIIKAIMAKPDQFDSIWDAMQKELIDIGIEKAEAEMTKLIKERIELWEPKNN